MKTLNEMSLEEKASLITGNDFWTFGKNVNGFGLVYINGPHGLGRQSDQPGDHIGLSKERQRSICFPTASALASSFDINLAYMMGSYLADICHSQGVDGLLGPGCNIKRSPLCGRNFEYYSEDPYLSAEMATSQIRGMEDNGIGSSLKHFICNNQENDRMTLNVNVDERTLREIYLSAFEKPIREGKPSSLMCSYNQVNNTLMCENENLLIDVVRNEWDYKGVVVSDWGASDEIVTSIKSGLDLEMPSSGALAPKKVLNAVKNNELSEESLDKACERIIELVESKRNIDIGIDLEAFHQKAVEVAADCMVLLKNNGILPLTANKRIAVIGEYARNPRIQGGGSSFVNPYKVDTLLDEFKKSTVDYEFAQGYLLKDKVDLKLQDEAVALAKKSEVVLINIGLLEGDEKEGVDRKHIDLPFNQVNLIKEVCKVNKHVVLILNNGSSVALPFKNSVSAILETWLSGEGSAQAVMKILFGEVNPSGRLAETFPDEVLSHPVVENYDSIDRQVYYDEQLLVGYRYFDTYKIPVTYPFGLGLSYSNFVYSNLEVSLKKDLVEVSLDICNEGPFDGKEVVQIYIEEINPIVFRPKKELKAFKKIHLGLSQTKRIYFELPMRSFMYYSVHLNDWSLGSKCFKIHIGKSIENIVFEKDIVLNHKVKSRDYEYKVYKGSPKKALPYFHRNTPLKEIRYSWLGKFFYRSIKKRQNDEVTLNLPLRSFVNFSKGKLSDRTLRFALDLLNLTKRRK